MRVIAALVFALAFPALLARPARAEPRAPQKQAERSPAVAVLPFVAASDKLSMYGKPVADAVARKLAALSGKSVEALPLVGDVPEKVQLVVDGRILAGKRGTIRLEARLRDPRTGTARPAVATAARPLAEIDALAENLAGKLAPGLKQPARPVATPAATPQTAIRENPAIRPPANPAPPAKPPAPTPPQKPRAIVFAPEAPPHAQAALTRHLSALARRLGYAPIISHRARGIADPKATRAALAETGASLVLMMDVSALDFVSRGVLTARGQARLVVVARPGRAALDRRLATDTVVGSRGDGRAALAALVAEQLVTIAAPAVKRALQP